MRRINQILSHPKYQLYLSKIEELEKKREFCCHNLMHFLDVARIGYILNLELKLNISKELIYGVAFLHDIGRWCQYETGELHEKASARLAKEILEEIDYSINERDEIIDAILSHRNEEAQKGKNLAGIMYRADKESRACFNCKKTKECYWHDSKKNLKVII
jgi:HD superfamily phosphodiesterase